MPIGWYPTFLRCYGPFGLPYNRCFADLLHLACVCPHRHCYSQPSIITDYHQIKHVREMLPFTWRFFSWHILQTQTLKLQWNTGMMSTWLSTDQALSLEWFLYFIQHCRALHSQFYLPLKVIYDIDEYLL